jgi:outer membrane lipoprotein SlyB
MTFTSPISLISASALCLALGACASTGPAGPSLAVMPGKGKSYEAFQRDDDMCQLAAQRSIGYQSPGEAGNQTAVSNAAVGTALGALAGAAIGAASGRAGAGAAIGAGSGLLLGSAVGSSNGQQTSANLQARYDNAYAQCMTAKGHNVLASAPPPVREVTYVYERPEPVYVYPRPYGWGPDYRRRYYYYHY